MLKIHCIQNYRLCYLSFHKTIQNILCFVPCCQLLDICILVTIINLPFLIIFRISAVHFSCLHHLCEFSIFKFL